MDILKRTPIFAVLLVIVVLFTYRGEITAPLSSDARFLAYQNSFITEPGGFTQIWLTDFFEGSKTGTEFKQVSGYYRPVTNSIFWIEYRLWGENDSRYHLVGFLLHALNSFILFLTVLRVFGNRTMAMITSLLFALHPINSFVATEVGSRSDALFFTFYLSAMWSYSSALLSNSKSRLKWGVAIATIFYLLAVMSKEMGATLPMELLLLHIYFYYSKGIPIKRAVWTAPLWISLGLYFVWRLGVLEIWPQTIGYSEVYPAYVVYLNLIKNVPIYILRILFPHGADYPELFPTLFNFIDETVSEPLIYASIAIILLMVSLAVILRKRSPEVAFLLAFFLVTLAPLLGVNNISGTMNIGQILAQERWIYLPSIGLFMLIGLLATNILEKSKSYGKQNYILASLISVFMLLSWMSSIHGTEMHRHMATLKHYYLMPEDKMSRLDKVNKLILYTNLVSMPKRNYKDAEGKALKAVELAGDSPFPAFTLARVYAEQKKWKEVIQTLSKWIVVPKETVLRLTKTNFRVLDGIHRTNRQTAYLFAIALANTGYGRDSAHALCLALERGFKEESVAEALKENWILNGPDDCLKASDKADCFGLASTKLPPNWVAPLNPNGCRSWDEKIAGKKEEAKKEPSMQ